jgi:hypothetical protein
MSMAQQVKYQKATHTIPSGMGGVFGVKIIEKNGDKIKVMVCHKFDGWYGKEYIVDDKSVKEIC